MDATARATLEDMVRGNEVSDRIEVRGGCGPEELREAVGDGVDTLVVCDVEGHEAELLDPQRCPGLQRAHVLVELHEFVHRGIGALLVRRFEPTHRVSEIPETARSIRDFPYRTWYTRLLPRSYLAWAVSE